MKRDDPRHEHPALALVELASLARGAVVLDALLKRSPVSIREASAVSPGKYLILFGGGVAEVEEAFAAATATAAEALVDQLLLPQAHVQIHDGLEGRYRDAPVDSLGLFETYTAAASVLSLDAALKATDIDLVGLQLCRGIGGKGVWTLSGPLHLVEAAVAAAEACVEPRLMLTREVIARPHDDALAAYLAPFRA